MKKLNKLLNLILPLFTVGFLVLLWAVVAKIQDNNFIVPTVMQTVKKFFSLFLEKAFYRAFGLTVLRSLISFVISFLISAVLAYFAVKSRIAEKLILPLVAVMRALPTIAIAWLMVFWTNEQIAPVVITMLVVMPTSYTHVKSALESVNKNSLEAGMVDGAGRFNLFFRIELPQIAPDICSITGSGLALNLKLMVAAEVLGATVKSLGSLLNMSYYSFEVSLTLALTAVILLFGLLIEFLFNAISKKTGDWK